MPPGVEVTLSKSLGGYEPMSNLDLSLAHRHFSADCFNRTWDLIEKPARTAEEDEAMLLCASASLWHWLQRADRTDRNLSIGHWQMARVLSLLGQGHSALQHGKQSLHFAAGSPPFFVACAHEAIARAAFVVGDRELAKEHLEQATRLSSAVNDAEERASLERDIHALVTAMR